MNILVCIISPTAHGGCEILTFSKSNGQHSLPYFESIKNAQIESLEYSQKLLNIQNVELMTYLGCNQDVQAYILRTIRAQIEPARLSKLGCEFIPLNQDLFEKLEVQVTVFWKPLLDYVQEYMVWE